MPARLLSKSSKARVYCLAGSIFLLFSLIIWRLFFIQIEQHDFYQALAAEQSQSFDPQVLYRGEILTTDNYVLAINKRWPMVYAVPKKIKNPAQTAEQLADLLGMNQDIIYKRLSKLSDPYEPLKQKISDETAQ